jgi:hypothetical protein
MSAAICGDCRGLSARISLCSCGLHQRGITGYHVAFAVGRSNRIRCCIDKAMHRQADHEPAVILFRLFAAVSMIVLGILLYFFVIGIADGSVSAFNIVLWLGLLASTGLIVGGGVVLKRKGRPRAATALLAVMAVPGIAAGLFILVLIVSQPKWN